MLVMSIMLTFKQIQVEEHTPPESNNCSNIDNVHIFKQIQVEQHTPSECSNVSNLVIY